MFTITKNFMPARPLLRPKPEQKRSSEEKERVDSTIEPDIRLWKLTADAVQPKLVRSELLVLVVFLAVVVSAAVDSVQELSRLMRSNAIEHVTARALEGPPSEVRRER
jgi:hypothetical protein